MPTLSGCNLELVKRPPDGASFLWSVGTCTGKFERRSFDLLGHGAQNDTPMGKEWHPKTGALLSRMRADRYAVCDWLLDPANAFTLRHERNLHTGGSISADKVSLFRADTESAGRAHIKAWAALNGVDVVALTMQGSSLDRFEEDVTIYRATGAEVQVSGKFAKDVQPRLDALRAGMPTAPFVLVRFEADHFDAILDLVAHPSSQGVPASPSMRHLRPMLVCPTATRGTCAGPVTVSRFHTSPPPTPSPDFMASVMNSQRKLRTLQQSHSKEARLLSPVATCRPLVGRDASGRLCVFPQSAVVPPGAFAETHLHGGRGGYRGGGIEDMSSQPGPGGWERSTSFGDGFSSSQRGLPPRTLRMGPGPEQSMPHTNHSLSSSGYSLSQRTWPTVV